MFVNCIHQSYALEVFVFDSTHVHLLMLCEFGYTFLINSFRLLNEMLHNSNITYDKVVIHLKSFIP